MYKFKSMKPNFRAKLRDETGAVIGYATFIRGECVIDDIQQARAIANALPDLTELGIEQLTPFAEADAEDGPEQTQSAEPIARRKGRKQCSENSD